MWENKTNLKFNRKKRNFLSQQKLRFKFKEFSSDCLDSDSLLGDVYSGCHVIFIDRESYLWIFYETLLKHNSCTIARPNLGKQQILIAAINNSLLNLFLWVLPSTYANIRRNSNGIKKYCHRKGREIIEIFHRKRKTFQ